jgi:amidohydrolase
VDVSDIEELKKEAFKIEDEMAGEIEGISDFIFNHPELGGEEFESSKFLANLLSNYGFEVVYPYLNIPTAFRAEIGTQDRPAFAFLAEYDALPGMGDDGSPAHACGHNWISATSVGAGLVLGRIKEKLPGRIVVFGTPAEETLGYKVNMVEKGAFETIDAAFQLHLENNNLLNTSALAMDALEFEFTGKAAHAASFPHEGINALDAVNLTFAGINALRQHVTSDVRIHGIITKGGEAPNIVPDYCACRFYVRANRRHYLNKVSERIINCARGAAFMTGAKLTVNRFENPLDDLVINPVLRKIGEQNLRMAGFDDFKEIDEFPGSSDIGNVSHVVPTVYGYIDIGPKVEVHEREFVKYANGPDAKIRLHKAVKGMVGTTIDVLLQPGLLEEIKKAFALSVKKS